MQVSNDQSGSHHTVETVVFGAGPLTSLFSLVLEEPETGNPGRNGPGSVGPITDGPGRVVIPGNTERVGVLTIELKYIAK